MRIEKPGDWFTPELAEKPYSIQTTFLHWMAAHGAMCLALRHPQMTGPSRQLVIDVIDGIERLFKAEGMPRDELNQIHMIESDAGGEKQLPSIRGDDDDGAEGVASKSSRTGDDNDAIAPRSIAPRKKTAKLHEAYEEEGDRARRRVRSHA